MSAPLVTTKPVFLASWLCPYVQRAWAALVYKGVEFEYVHIDLQSKPSWFPSISPLGKVPVLTWKDEADKTQIVHESLVLLEFIDEQYKGAPLYPPTPVERAHARIAINRIDQKLVAAFHKLLYAAKEDKDADIAQALGKELDVELDWLESELAARDSAYLFGKDFGAVDAAVAPFVLRANILEHLRGYRILKDRPKLTAYVKTLRDTPAIIATLTGPDDKPAESFSAWEHDLIRGIGHRFAVHRFF